MPFCSALASALVLRSSSLIIRAASSSVNRRIASATVTRLDFFLPPPMFWNMPWICCVSSSMPGGPEDFHLPRRGADLDLDFRVVERTLRAAFCGISAGSPVFVGCMSSKLTACGAGSNKSRTFSSAWSAARDRGTFFISDSRICLIAMSARSRMMVSTSRPTYPTSVNFVASTLMNGASASRARRRAISVLPTPVGPIIRMFLGVISWRSGSATCCRRHRLRSAIATARLASCCPMMCLSSS